MALNIMD